MLLLPAFKTPIHALCCANQPGNLDVSARVSPQCYPLSHPRAAAMPNLPSRYLR